MAKPKSDRTTSAALAAPADDFTPPGVDVGPFDIPTEWLAEEAELKRQRAVIERAIAIRDNLIPPPWVSKPKPKKERAKPATESAEAALLALYPPDGRAPAGQLITEITGDIRRWCKANVRRKLPGRDVVGDVVEKFGRQ